MYILNLEIQSMGVRLHQGEAFFRVICACETEMLLLLACIFAQSFPLSTPLVSSHHILLLGAKGAHVNNLEVHQLRNVEEEQEGCVSDMN